jgi:protein-tyrosine phosphatase
MQVAGKAGLDIDVDSAGTGNWHVGDPPDPRAQDIARSMGVDIGHLRARQISPDDFHRFTHILALDRANLRAIERMRPATAPAETGLLLDYVIGREGQEVADPYYGDAHGFEITWTDVTAGAEGIVAVLSAAK